MSELEEQNDSYVAQLDKLRSVQRESEAIINKLRYQNEEYVTQIGTLKDRTAEFESRRRQIGRG